MKKGIRERLSEVTEIPKDFFMNMPRVVLVGNKEIQIDNYKGLIEYSDTVIRVATTNKQIVIKGIELGITRLTKDMIFIGGNILAVEFCTKYKYKNE